MGWRGILSRVWWWTWVIGTAILLWPVVFAIAWGLTWYLEWMRTSWPQPW